MARSTSIRPTSARTVEPGAAETPDHPPVAEDAAALASYIADMTAELAKLAGGAHMPMLAYFLNLARVEAEMQTRREGGAPISRAK